MYVFSLYTIVSIFSYKTFFFLCWLYSLWISKTSVLSETKKANTRHKIGNSCQLTDFKTVRSLWFFSTNLQTVCIYIVFFWS